ncbi:hypothetical protein Q765_13090 [Flavobacterium rivuli WB 3.3-2 = DSM 21788]|uniref:Uncharacterized protein n=1 Tax=Flavobacterium rivuli WB 3.3-2 = DSM 21788 TaxID=1121895 RepID=A0A0A2M3E5_9FLAO|nr:hypothetical protein [Flavobacterium rivuli]KGO85993.1 hypothetical protein Q765_13090 [Flavobacterium rivuli WB 3.3-2 = DSM 21788]
MEQPALSPKQIIVDLLSIQPQLDALFRDNEDYKELVKFLTSKDYYNDPDIAYPTLTEVQKATGLPTSRLRKLLIEMYETLYHYESTRRLAFKNTEYIFYLRNEQFRGQFTLDHLQELPRVGEEVQIPFLKARLNTELFHVEKVAHNFEGVSHYITIWLQEGFYNSYWHARKDEAILKGEISRWDIYNMSEYDMKKHLGLPPH